MPKPPLPSRHRSRQNRRRRQDLFRQSSPGAHPRRSGDQEVGKDVVAVGFKRRRKRPEPCKWGEGPEEESVEVQRATRK